MRLTANKQIYRNGGRKWGNNKAFLASRDYPKAIAMSIPTPIFCHDQI